MSYLIKVSDYKQKKRERSEMKKFALTVLTVGCAFFLFACADGTKTQVESGILKETGTEEEVQTEETSRTEAEAGAEGVSQTEEAAQYEYPPEDNGSVLWESELGYSMTYNPMVFTLDDTGEQDIFTYNTAESSGVPVYMSVQSYPDMDAQTLAEGLALQSGMDGVEVQDVRFGADGLDTKNVYIEREAEGLTQIQIFYAIPADEGALLVEIGSYVGVPVVVDGYFEEMLGTFSLSGQ